MLLVGCILLHASKGHTCFSPPCVRTSPCIFLDVLEGHKLASDKDDTLTSMQYPTQGIALLPIVETPTPNDLRSSFFFGRSLYILAGPTLSRFLEIEGRPNDKVSPQSLFGILTHLSWLIL